MLFLPVFNKKKELGIRIFWSLAFHAVVKCYALISDNLQTSFSQTQNYRSYVLYIKICAAF